MHRKIGAALAGLAVGLAGAFALAGPAQATDTETVEGNPLQTSSTGAQGVSCPPGTVVVGGGFTAELGDDSVAVSEAMEPDTSYPHHTTKPGETGWYIENGQQPQEITVHAKCAPGLTVTVDEAECESTVLTFTNMTGPYTFSGDYRVDGQDGVPDDESTDDHGVTPHQTIEGGPFDGEEFGLRYNPVPLPPGSTETVTLDFEPESGEHTVAYRIWRGPENNWYVPWDEVTIDCGQPDPKPTEEPTETKSPAPGKGGGDDDDKPGLPVTGAALPILGGVGAGAAALGTVLFLIGRKRRSQFTAE